MFAGGQGDANFHSTYIVGVASRQRVKFEILVFSGGQEDAHFHSMYILILQYRYQLVSINQKLLGHKMNFTTSHCFPKMFL